MAYIRIDKDLINDPRLFALAERLEQIQASALPAAAFGIHANRNALRNALLGALVTLWCYADTHIRNDDTLPISLSSLSDVIGLPVEFLEHLPADWLTIQRDGTVKLPGYIEKNGIISKNRRREQTRSRVARWRQENDRRCNADGNALHRATTGTGTGTGTDPLPLPKPKKQNPPSSLMSIPQVDGLDAEAWKQFVEYRHATGKAIKPPSVKASQRRLVQLSMAGGTQAEIVEQSIANGWQGLFALKDAAQPASKPKSQGKLHRAAQALKEWHEREAAAAVETMRRTGIDADDGTPT